ncbi:MAG TPA: cell wall hydrolase [Deltaproteobacteria bacterium]|nr:cell wall hydrolase [Deltaproteobacteria bacterium]HQI00659.1 cell wall hydrolase [Deltaproteobacteria bacterium]
MKKTLAAVAVLFCMSLPLENAIAGELPACLHLGKSPTVRSVIEAGRIAEEEVLARLVYAESLSTGYADDQAVYEAIAWGVMNRVRLSRAFPSKARIYGSGIKGVIFKEGQFNPAVSKRSRFSKEFLCPSDKARWRMAELAALKALAGSGNPFIETPWEKEHGLSLVVGFYYPHSIQAKSPLAPWEKSRALKFIGDVKIGGTVLSSRKVRFYRLTSAPVDAGSAHALDEK